MKKIKLSFISAILSLILLMPLFQFVISAECQTNLSKYEAEIIPYIEKYVNSIKDDDLNYKVISCYNVESFTGKKEYTIFSLSPIGFVIYDEYTNVIEEINLGSDSPYQDMQSTTGYYGGPMNYVYYKNGNYYLIDDNIKLSDDDIHYLQEIEQITINLRNTEKSLPFRTATDYMSSSAYFTNLLGDDFGTNVNNTCIQLACAIMLGHYDNYFDDSFVPTAYEYNDGTTDSFHQLLQTYIGTSFSTFSVSSNGLNAYLSSIHFTSQVSSYHLNDHDFVYSKVIANIYNNKSTVIGMNSSYNTSCPINHAVVAYGCYQEFIVNDLTNATYYVHTGWHSNKLGAYSWDWFSDCLYIQ